MKKSKIAGIILLSMLLTGCGGNAANREMIKAEPVVLQVDEVDELKELQGVVSKEQAAEESLSIELKKDGTEKSAGIVSKEEVTEELSDAVPKEVTTGQMVLSGFYESINGSVDNSVDGSDGTISDLDQMGFGDPATMNNNVDGRELPIYCVDTQENKVALSFDAAWGAEDTEEILAILKKHNIHVTFFATGGWVESYPEDVKAVLAAGHDLGNHSENHLNMSELSNGEKKEEIMSVHEKVKELTGYEMFLFRPPYGDYDNDVINVARNCGYYAIQWDVDSLDWMNKGVDSIIETVTKHKNLGSGSIILCHNGAEYTVQALDDLITGLEEQGYEIVPVSELIYRENFHLNYEGRQIAD